MKSFNAWLTESSQAGFPKGRRGDGKRSKEEEIAIAKQSPIFKDTQYQGWKIEISVHAAAQAYDRRPEFEFNQWKDLHRKAINGIGKGSGDFIVYSKSMEQGYVVSVSNRKKHLKVVTVLPRGRKNPKPGTELVLVEQMFNNNEIELIEVE